MNRPPPFDLPDHRVLVADANLRDLGGLPTADGRTVRTGRLFRSGYLCDLEGPDHAILEGLGLRTIVDLRRLDEAQQRPHPDLDGTEVVHVSVSTDDNEFAVLANRMATDPAAIPGPDLIADYFRNSVRTRLDRYRQVFDLATDPDRHPLLFNCTAGKDRTGFVGGILLRLLGVTEELTIADYLLSNEVRRPWLQVREDQHRRMIADRLGIEPGDVPDEHLVNTRAMLWCHADYLAASFATVEEDWGTWEAFRRDGLGLDDARIGAFRDAMLA
jgi:protein-tyrosine phosphatase